MPTTLCSQDMGHGTAYAGSIFFRCYYRGSFAKFYGGVTGNGYLDDMCYVKLSRNRNFPFANIIAELSRTQKMYLQCPLHKSPSRTFRSLLICMYACWARVYPCVFVGLYGQLPPQNATLDPPMVFRA